MNDLISRKAAIDALISEGRNVGCRYPAERVINECDAIEVISLLPSAEPKRSKWRHYEGVLTCIECGAEFYDDIMEYTGDEVPHFCPDCGANMEG